MKKKYHIVLVHIIYWILFFLTEYKSVIFSEYKNEVPVDLSSQQFLLSYSFITANIVTFYINYCIVIPWFFKKKEIINLLLAILFNFLVFSFSRYSLEEILYPLLFGFRNYHEKTSLWFYFFDNLYYGSYTIFISSLIWFLDFSIKTERKNEELIKEKSEAENSLLKSQINPHFVFNTLNNIYALVNMKSDKSLIAIEKLGDLLRFSSTEIMKDFTPLENEISYAKSYIDLESFRLQHPENITFINESENTNLKIAPMLLIPFVENAFKHGDLKNGKLIINIKTTNNVLYFHQKNKISKSLQKDKSSGIGIDNVKKRLKLIYPQKHHLKISSVDDTFVVDLEIELT